MERPVTTIIIPVILNLDLMIVETGKQEEPPKPNSWLDRLRKLVDDSTRFYRVLAFVMFILGFAISSCSVTHKPNPDKHNAPPAQFEYRRAADNEIPKHIRI